MLPGYQAELFQEDFLHSGEKRLEPEPEVLENRQGEPSPSFFQVG